MADPVFDPFLGTSVDTHRVRAYCNIVVNGVDVTDRLNPHLISVRILDSYSAEYQAEVELDDRDGRLPIPPFGVPMTVALGWTTETTVRKFDGLINEIESMFNRHEGGRKMIVRGRGMLEAGAIKSPTNAQEGEGAPPGEQQGQMLPFTTIAAKLAQTFGGNINVHPEIAAAMRDHWAAHNESPMQWFEKMSKELGYVWRVEGGSNVVITKPGTKGGIIAKWNDGRGGNLISWRVHPWTSEAMWGGAANQFFDTRQAQWMSMIQKFGLPGPWGQASAIFGLPMAAPNSGVAQQRGGGTGEFANKNPTGRIVINGEPAAEAMGTVQLIGARDGVDGLYDIWVAEHRYNRQGYVTWLEVRADLTVSGGSILDSGYFDPQGNPIKPQAAPTVPAVTTINPRT